MFPGGVGTAEEILYLLGVLSHPDNADMPLPLVMTGPASSAPYFRQIDEFIAATLGDKVREHYSIVIEDPKEVARKMLAGLGEVRDYRKRLGDAYYFNWRLRIDRAFQTPFTATHESMASLDIDESLDTHELAVNLRRVFSGIVSGNVREDTAAVIDRDGPFEINGSGRIMSMLDELLSAFVGQGRMKLASADYKPCYRIK